MQTEKEEKEDTVKLLCNDLFILIKDVFVKHGY